MRILGGRTARTPPLNPLLLSAFKINKSKTLESKGYKRFATTEAEIEEKRLKLNVERTIKQIVS